ncbi:hypothetical protein ECOPMV1_00269 [Escherichia coli PMV-1]|uniref:hypothetical protein n=1 Tax=Escherichia coli TaxID=562 RepID=UPI0003AB7002|nr:hypothetical protein ECOPMV1_00269 [Escherichia coli PMV-1]
MTQQTERNLSNRFNILNLDASALSHGAQRLCSRPFETPHWYRMINRLSGLAPLTRESRSSAYV